MFGLRDDRPGGEVGSDDIGLRRGREHGTDPSCEFYKECLICGCGLKRVQEDFG